MTHAVQCDLCPTREASAIALASTAVRGGWFVTTLSDGKTVTLCPACADRLARLMSARGGKR